MLQALRRLIGVEVHRPQPWPGVDCPATQRVARARRGAYLTTNRLLMAEVTDATGREFPVVAKMLEG